MLARLAVEAGLPDAVQLLLFDALAAWAPLMRLYLFPTDPEAGMDCEFRQLLVAIWWRRSGRPSTHPGRRRWR